MQQCCHDKVLLPPGAGSSRTLHQPVSTVLRVPSDRELIAHLLRRTGFGPHPGQVDRLVPMGIDGAFNAVLRAPPQEPGKTPSLNDDDRGPVESWLKAMAQPSAGLHEKLVWFWHGHLTSSEDKVGSWRLMYGQHLLLRRHALGNFRELLEAVTVDPAMLMYLDGDGSTADAPNENYGREILELFALGRGHYTQADVRAGALAFSGWSVDERRGTAKYDSESGAPGPVMLLGRSVDSAAAAVDAICDHPACALWVTARLHRFLLGEEPSADRAEVLSRRFRSGGLEIRPVVEDIIRHPSFLAARQNRARSPVEWVIAAAAALGRTGKSGELADACYQLGQVPFEPPNVSGWPQGLRWLAAGYAEPRAALALQSAQNASVAAVAAVRGAADPVVAALERCSLFEVSAATRNALTDADRLLRSDPSSSADDRARTLLALVLSTPEFALA
jgi:uncharacterized protein (DUF1800 family)